MKRRVLALCLIGMLSVAAFTGCKDKDNNEETPAGTEQESATVAAEPDKEYSEYVKLGEYKGMNIEVESVEKTDEELKESVDAYIQKLLESKGTTEQITDRVVADGDKIHLQYTGLKDGVAFNGGSTGEAGVDYTIGGNYIEDLNDQLIGLECGKDYELECTFPEEYDNADLAGQDVIFQVKVDYIYGETIVPEWTDEFISDYTESEYTNTADYEKYVGEQIILSDEEEQKSSYQAKVWENILENSEILGYPQNKLNDTVDQYYEMYKAQYTSVAAQYSMTYEDFLALYQMTDESLKESCEEQARAELEYIMLAVLIADKEGIELSDDEYESMAEEIATQYSYESIDEFEKDYGKDYIVESFIFKKVSDMLYENNTMVITEAAETETSNE